MEGYRPLFEGGDNARLHKPEPSALIKNVLQADVFLMEQEAELVVAKLMQSFANSTFPDFLFENKKSKLRKVLWYAAIGIPDWTSIVSLSILSLSVEPKRSSRRPKLQPAEH